MRTSPDPPLADTLVPAAGRGLRQRTETIGAALADSLGRVLARLPRRMVGPQVLANTLGITTVTASRLLKALGQNDPIATLQAIPGPKPLRTVVDAAREAGVPEAECATAIEAIESFDALIRTEAGDRRSFAAMMSAWLPDDRAEFETQRRQSIFKAMSELDGVSSELELNCLVLHPSTESKSVDIVNIKCLLGVDRMRPDAVVKLGTQRLAAEDAGLAPDEGEDLDPSRPRIPTNLAGEPALDGMHTVRLDEFCTARPAPLAVRRFGPFIEYSLGPTGFGPASKVDLVIAEVNRDELSNRAPSRERPPYFYTIPEMACRRLVFDLLVHRDVYPACDPTLIAYDMAGRGPAVACDPARDLDRRQVLEQVANLGPGLTRLRVMEFPRYSDLLALAFEKLAWDSGEFRSYRIAIPYPLVGTQITLAFRGPE